MKLVVGLGNPGRKYLGTRHNIGFMVLDELARRHAAHKPKVAFQGEVTEVMLGPEKALLLWPHTFMNLSGGSALAARDFYKIADEDVLVISDDMNLPLGKLRIRASGSAGGQKGLADILRRFGHDKVGRLRIGIGSPPDNFDGADFVLSKFRKDEEAEIGVSVVVAGDAVTHWAQSGIASTMNKYNQ
jgi:PTH1 family peptidyl-tRNA hydrolase